MKGGNITDITQFDGLRLTCKYWSTVKPTEQNLSSVNIHFIDSSLVFVGDVHGDLNQFLAPLVYSGIIQIIDDEVKEHKVFNDMVYTPNYTIAKSSTMKIIYLGDLVDEWIFSKTIIYMMNDILRTLPNNVKYIYGNHDLGLIGRYYLYRSKTLNFALDTPALWQTLKKELNHVSNLKLYRTTVELDGEPSKGYDYIHSYTAVLFEYLFNIFKDNLGSVALNIEINGKPYMISHTTWTTNALRQLILPHENYTIHNSDRPGDSLPEQKQQLVPNSADRETLLAYTDTIRRTLQLAEQSQHEQINYKQLCETVNMLFHFQSRLFISKSLLTYTRITKNIFLNHIIGHSSGAEFRDQGVNPGPSTYYTERLAKLTPTFFNNRTVYYFDFGCSAGYDHDEISHPDFVYSNDKGLFVSNLPAFSFILSNGKDCLLVLADKTPRSSNRISISNE